MMELLQLWPQNWVNLDCIVAISMDLCAPFLADMGLPIEGASSIRSAFRERIEQEERLFGTRGAGEDKKLGWLHRVDLLLLERTPDVVRTRLWDWIRDTYTYVPADRPSWEAYEVFFFQWSVKMRVGVDIASCFIDPEAVFLDHDAFIGSRQLRRRIRERRGAGLSDWDRRMFRIREYSLDEDQLERDECNDVFGVVEVTSNRNYFQQFWEYLNPRLTPGEPRVLWVLFANIVKRPRTTGLA